jgi:nucleoside-diphosphate-sugar epimerase
MKYFITGATGFIGGEVARQLLDAGHAVVALARTPSKAEDLAARGAAIHQGDITDKDSMREGMRGVDGVFHIAAWYEIGVRDTGRMERINIDGTRNVLELMRELDIPQGVYTSTVGVFSDTQGQMVDETYRHEGAFVNHYERTKWIAHYEIAQPMIDDGLPLVIVLPGLVYGPGDHSLVRDQLLQYVKGRLFVAPKGTAYCWAHVEDTARGHILAMEKGQPGESYIIAGQPATLTEALKYGEEAFGIPAPRVQIPPAVLKGLAGVLGVVERVIPLRGLFAAESLRTVAGVTYLGSNAKAKRELGYAPRPLSEGLVATARYEMEQLGIEPKR